LQNKDAGRRSSRTFAAYPGEPDCLRPPLEGMDRMSGMARALLDQKLSAATTTKAPERLAAPGLSRFLPQPDGDFSRWAWLWKHNAPGSTRRDGPAACGGVIRRFLTTTHRTNDLAVEAGKSAWNRLRTSAGRRPYSGSQRPGRTKLAGWGGRNGLRLKTISAKRRPNTPAPLSNALTGGRAR